MGIVAKQGLSLPEELEERLSFRSEIPFFQSIEWFRCLIDTGVFTAEDVRVVTSDRHRWALFTRPGGRGEIMSLSNYYSGEFGLSGTASADELNELVHELMHRAGASGRVELRHLKTRLRATDDLVGVFGRSRFLTGRLPQFANWCTDVKGLTAEAYLEARPSRLRNTIARGQNRLARSHALRWMLVDRDDGELDRAIAAFDRVYRRSWKPPENHPRFVPALIRTCAGLGNLRLGLLFAGERPIAAQLWIKDGVISHIYKLAHDPDFDAYSVGSLLTARMFQHAIDHDEAHTIDFGMGDERYKRDWVDQRHEIFTLQALDPWRFRGAAAAIRRGAGRLGHRLRLINC